MLRPTKQNFQRAAHLLDKLISENINIDFFRGDVDLKEEIERSDGRIELSRIGTLNLLRNWFRRYYRTADGEDVSDEVVEVFKQIRSLRQKPAHSIGNDEYDLDLPGKQDQMLGDACRSLTKLRLALTSHPRASGVYEAPDWLDRDKIVFY